jgi:hypothetical protein
VTEHLHHHAFADALAAVVPGGGASEVVKQAAREAGALACAFPRGVEVALPLVMPPFRSSLFPFLRAVARNGRGASNDRGPSAFVRR